MFTIIPFTKTPYKKLKLANIRHGDQYLVSRRGISMSDIVLLRCSDRFSLLLPGELCVFRHDSPQVLSIRKQIPAQGVAFSRYVRRLNRLSARHSVPLSERAAKPKSVRNGVR